MRFVIDMQKLAAANDASENEWVAFNDAHNTGNRLITEPLKERSKAVIVPANHRLREFERIDISCQRPSGKQTMSALAPASDACAENPMERCTLCCISPFSQVIWIRATLNCSLWTSIGTKSFRSLERKVYSSDYICG